MLYNHNNNARTTKLMHAYLSVSLKVIKVCMERRQKNFNVMLIKCKLQINSLRHRAKHFVNNNSGRKVLNDFF